MHPESKNGIVVVGIHTSAYVMRCQRLPSPGEYILSRSYRKSLDGGKASNQALAAARLGAISYLVARVGNDAEGNSSLSYLSEHGVDTAFVSKSDTRSTGMGIAFIDDRGVPMGLTEPGAAIELSEGHISQAASAFQNSKIMLTQLEIPVDLALYACEMGKRFGLTVILNPAPADGLDVARLKHVDILTPNEPEAKVLAGFSPDEEVDIEYVGRRLFEESRVKSIIITRGEHGSLLINHAGIHAFACPQVNVVDTSGAGDCFNAALAVALNRGFSLNRAIELASKAASLSVTKNEVWPSYPTWGEVEEYDVDP